MDQSGAMAEPTKYVLDMSHALYKWVNDTNYIPGIKIEYVTEDDRYDRAQIVTCYKRLQEKNPLVIQFYTGDNAEVLKPLAERDKIPVVGYGGGTLAVEPPGWTFVTVCMYDCQSVANIKFVSETWDMVKMGRKAKYVHSGWDNAMGKTGVEPSKLYCAKLPNVEFAAAEIVPPRTTDMSAVAIRLKDLNPDYVWMALIAPPSSSLVKSAKGLGMDTKKFIWGDYSTFMFDTVLRVLTPADLEGCLASTSFYYKSMNTPELKRMFELWDKYVGRKPYPPEIGMQVGYNPAQVIVEGIKRAVAKVGADKLNGTAVYEALQTIKNWETGTCLPLTYGADRRDGVREAMFYQFKDGEFRPLSPKRYDGGTPHPKDLLAEAAKKK